MLSTHMDQYVLSNTMTQKNASQKSNLSVVNFDLFKITHKGKAQDAINVLPLTYLQKLILLVLLTFLNTKLAVQNIFPQIGTILEKMGPNAPGRRWLQRNLNIIVELGFLEIFDTYQYLPDGKLDQLSSSYYFTPLLLAFGTEHEESVRTYVLSSRGQRPSVLMKTENLSFSEAFKKGTAKKILGGLKLFVSPKKKGGGDGLQTTLIPKVLIPESSSSNKSSIDIKPSYITNPGFKRVYNNYAPVITEMYNRLKPFHERFDLICEIQTSEDEKRKQAGILVSRCKDENGEVCEKKILHYLSGFTRSLNALASCPTLKHSDRSSLGRLYDWKDLEAASRAQLGNVRNIIEFNRNDPTTVVETIALYSINKGADPARVVVDYLGEDIVNQYSQIPIEEEALSDDLLRPYCLFNEEYIPSQEEIDEFYAMVESEEKLEDVPDEVVCEPSPKFVLSEVVSQISVNPMSTPPRDKTPKELAVDGVVAHLTRLGARSYESKLRSLLEHSSLDYVMMLYDNPNQIILELSKQLKKSA